MRFNKYLPFAVIYFFFNSLALPFGLTYTALLAPLFYAWVIRERRKEILWPFLLTVLPFVLIHLFVVGVDTASYLQSFVNLTLVYIFCQAAYTFFIHCHDIDRIFRLLLAFNFIACLLAIPVYFTPYWEWLWMEQNISTGVGRVRRLKLLTYEPSYYALLFTPLFFYFLLRYLFRLSSMPAWKLFPMLFLPFILSFSIGVIAAILITVLITGIIHFGSLVRRRRIFNGMINTGFVLSSFLLIVFLFFRNNTLFARLGNIVSGRDSSGNGRTVDAFILAEKLLKEKNQYWGVGLGQVKVVGTDIIRSYYFYYMDYAVAIPNAAAETLAIFGWAGLSLRIGIEVFLFFLTRVWSNYFRTLLFFFLFIYQFTGSYITNVAEYMVWIMAFSPVFREFDIRIRARSTDVEALPRQPA